MDMTLFRRSVLALPFSLSSSGRHLVGLRDNVVWNDFRAHFGEVVKIYHYIYSGFLKGNKIVSKRSKILGLSYLL